MAKAKVSADTVTTVVGDGVEEKQINVTVQLPSDVKTSGNTMKYIGRSSDMDNGYADTVTYLSVRVNNSANIGILTFVRVFPSTNSLITSNELIEFFDFRMNRSYLSDSFFLNIIHYANINH